MQVLTYDLLLISVLVQDAVVEFVYLVYLVHYVPFELFVGHAICCSHREGIRHQPVVYDSLGDRHELVCGVGPDIKPDGVNEATSA